MSATNVRTLLLILLVCGVCFFTRLGAPKLWDRDEPRNARCAYEMFQRHDLIVPTFNDELRAHKPILLYWLMMSAYSVFGVNEFSARFWSATLATGSVLLTYHMGRRLFDDRSATWAAVILATTLMFNVAAHAATPDSALIFCTTLAMSFFVASVPWTTARRTTGWSDTHRRWLAAAGLALGLGFLAKGPVGFVLPTVVWCAYVWLFSLETDRLSDGPWRWLGPRLRPRYLLSCCCNRRLLMISLVMLAVAAPWYVAVGWRTNGVWLHEFFVTHNVSRAVQPMEGHRGGMVWFYPAAILVGFFPWSAFSIPVTVWIAGRGTPETYDRRFAFLLTWVFVYVAAFSIAATKLPSYVTPIYPALALMVGHFVAHWPKSNRAPAHWWPRWSAATYMLVGGVLLLALPWAAHTYLPGEEWLGAIGAVLLVGGGVSLTFFLRQQPSAGFVSMTVSGLCFVVTLFAWVAPRISQHQHIDRLVATAQDFDRSAPVATLGVHEPSWVYYFGHSMPQWSLANPRHLAQELARSRGLMVTTRQQFDALRQEGPELFSVLAEIPYFLKSGDLVLLEATQQMATTQPA